MADTLRLQLPLLDAAQAQKHITHNEALNRLDLLVQISAKDKDLSDPPASPVEGDTYIVGPTALNEWVGHETEIAHYRDGGWIFQAPLEGQIAFIEDEAGLFVFSSGGWGAAVSGGATGLPIGGAQYQILVKQSGADGDALWQDQIALLGVNATPDGTNRLSAKSDAILFSHDDVTPGSGDIRVNVNKASVAGNASLLFQNGFSGRAEFGLTGDDDFHVKVSPDGTQWYDALIIDKDTGNLIADKPLVLKGFATASLPDATLLEGGIVYDNDVDMPKFSDGASWQNFGSGGATGGAVALDLGADGDDSAALSKIQTIGDTNNIATEISSDILQFDMSQAWPLAESVADGGISTEAKLAGGVVTNAKLADMSASTIKGRETGSGAPQDLSAVTVRSILNVEDGATADQTGGEIKALYEAELDTNALSDSLLAKLNGIEAGATADLSGAEIKALYEAEIDTNAFTDTLLSKLNGVEADATADLTGAEIKTLYEAEADTNGLSDADKAKLDHISVSTAVDLESDFQPQNASLSEIAGTSWLGGDLFTINGAGAVIRLAKGADGQILSLVSGAPAWVNDTGGGGGGGGTSVTVTQQSILTETALAQGTLAGTVSGATQMGII